MKIQLNPQLCTDLRNKINEHHNFTYEKTAAMLFPNQRNRVTAQAYNCICATLDRITDLVEHCNNIEISGQFGLCDFLNYTQSLIECITILGRVYDVPALYNGQNEHDVSIFHQPGLNGNGNDEKYFTYLRSLCSVHPVETSRHPQYQGSEAEWCPYISSGKNSTFALLANRYPELSGADFVATVYRNDMELCKYVPIHVNELIAYVEKRYLHIQAIIKAISDYNQSLIDTFEKKVIPAPETYPSYIDYLLDLQKAITERCGKENDHKTQEWIAIFKAHFDDQQMQSSLVAYQEALKVGIAGIHSRLQRMDIDFYFEDEPIIRESNFIDNSYALQKLHYLEEDFWAMSEADAYQLAESGGIPFNSVRIDTMLAALSEARCQGASMEELSEIAKSLDRKYQTTNSEWARLQLKIIEPCFDNVIDFDYHLNDWYLHLQVEIAFWLISQRS